MVSSKPLKCTIIARINVGRHFLTCIVWFSHCKWLGHQKTFNGDGPMLSKPLKAMVAWRKKTINHSIALKNWPSLWSSPIVPINAQIEFVHQIPQSKRYYVVLQIGSPYPDWDNNVLIINIYNYKYHWQRCRWWRWLTTLEENTEASQPFFLSDIIRCVRVEKLEDPAQMTIEHDTEVGTIISTCPWWCRQWCQRQSVRILWTSSWSCFSNISQTAFCNLKLSAPKRKDVGPWIRFDISQLNGFSLHPHCHFIPVHSVSCPFLVV